MNDSVTPKKVLLAEDERETLISWITGLYEEGFCLSDKTPEDVLRECEEPKLVVLSSGLHQFHITRYAHVAAGIVTGFRRPKDIVGATLSDGPYDACFMDRTLEYGEKSDNLVKIMLKEKLVPEIYMISADIFGQISAIRRGESFSTDQLQDQGRLIASNKRYKHNLCYLEKIIGFTALRPHATTSPPPYIFEP